MRAALALAAASQALAGYDPVAAMMAGAHPQQPMVGVNEFPMPGLYHPQAALMPFLQMPGSPAATVPPASAGPQVPGLPPMACAPYNPYGPTPPAMGQSFFTTPATLARGARAALMKQVPSKGLGFRTAAGATIAAGATATLNTPASGLPFCIWDLEIQPQFGQFFLVTSIFAAGREWLVAAGGVPAMSFSPESIHPAMEFPTVWPGVIVQVTVENIDGAPHPLFGNFWGIAGDSQPCM